MLTAVIAESVGAAVSGVVVPVPPPPMILTIPGGSVWHVGTIGATPPIFFNQPGAMRCPGGTFAQTTVPIVQHCPPVVVLVVSMRGCSCSASLIFFSVAGPTNP